MVADVPQMFRQFVKVDDTARKVLAVPELRSDVLVVGLLIRLYVNIDFLKARRVKGAPTGEATGPSRRARLSRAHYMDGARVHIDPAARVPLVCGGLRGA